jgi:hypothetical protein
MTIAQWSTIASLATALGTLILAVATFSAVRSSNLMAKVAQRQLLIQLRPVLAPSRREDPVLKVNFGDMKWVQIPGGGAVGEVGTGDGSMGANTTVVYLAIALRNAGNGIAVLQGWRFFPEAALPVEHQFSPHPGDHPGQAAEARAGWLASASRHWSLDRPDAP